MPVDPALTRTLPRVGFDFANNTQLFAPLRMTRAMRLRFAHPPECRVDSEALRRISASG